MWNICEIYVEYTNLHKAVVVCNFLPMWSYVEQSVERLGAIGSDATNSCKNTNIKLE
jgi:hypothetical protein